MGQYNEYKDFLANADTYRALREHWQRVFSQLAIERKQTYRPYLSENNRCDGNPIFDAYLPGLARAVRIVQEDASEAVAPVDISAWIDKATIMTEAEQEVPELVVSLVLNEWTGPIASGLLRLWLCPQAPTEALIDELIQSETPPFLKPL